MKKIDLTFDYDKTTENYHVFKKTRKAAPGIFPDRIYVDKEDLSEEPKAIRVQIEEIKS